MGQVEPWSDEARRTLADTLRDSIADAIISGDFEPGRRLDEVSIAQRYSVSRTPVREALKQLAAMDLVELRPHRGAVVTALDAARLSELVAAMVELEATCARLAALNMDDFDRLGFTRVWMRNELALRSGEDLHEVHVSNLEFHSAIYRGAHNGFLAECAWTLRRRLAPLACAQFGLTGRPAEASGEHRQVFDAIMERDGAAAELAMRRHMQSVGRSFDRWLERGGIPAAA